MSSTLARRRRRNPKARRSPTHPTAPPGPHNHSPSPGTRLLRSRARASAAGCSRILTARPEPRTGRFIASPGGDFAGRETQGEKDLPRAPGVDFPAVASPFGTWPEAPPRPAAPLRNAEPSTATARSRAQQTPSEAAGTPGTVTGVVNPTFIGCVCWRGHRASCWCRGAAGNGTVGRGQGKHVWAFAGV